jgi:hypothetical protein
MANNIDGGGSALQVPIEMGDTMAKDIDVLGNVQGRDPVAEGTGAAPVLVDEKIDMTGLLKTKVMSMSKSLVMTEGVLSRSLR